MEPQIGGLGIAQCAVVQVPSSPVALVVAATFPGCAPQVLFDYWIAPELLPLWWPPVATIDPRRWRVPFRLAEQGLAPARHLPRVRPGRATRF